MIKNIELHINSVCNYKCDYCFLDDSTDGRFTRWDDLKRFLSADTTKLNYLVDVNLTSGELSLFPELVRKAITEIRKVERYKDVTFRFGLYSNGSRCDNLKSLMDEGLLTPELVEISWDGSNSSAVRKSKDKKFYPIPIMQMSGYKYNDRIVYRSALTENLMDNIEETFSEFSTWETYNWEYYLLINYKKYLKNDFLRKFHKFFRFVLDYCTVVDVYNINTLYDAYVRGKSICKNWCGDKSKSRIYIDSQGLVYPCGFFTDKTRFAHKEFTSFDISDTCDMDHISNSVSTICSNGICKSAYCDIKHCSRCNNIEDKCYIGKLRKIERDVFLDYIRLQ